MIARKLTPIMIGSRPTEELETIVSCESAAELRWRTSANKYKELATLTTHINHEKHIIGVAQALNESLQLFMRPVNAFLVGIGAISLFVSSVFLLPITLGVLLAGIGFFAYGTHKFNKESKQKRQEAKEFFELADLKFQAFNTLTQRIRGAIHNLSPAASSGLQNNIWRKTYTTKPTYDKRSMVFESLGAAATPVITLGIAAIAVGSIFQTIGMLTMATFVFTPLGLAIAAGLAITGIAVGIFVGIKHYQSCVNKKLVEAEETKMKFLIREQEAEYRGLEKTHLELKLRQHSKEDIHENLKSAQQVVGGKILAFPSVRTEHAGLRFLGPRFNQVNIPAVAEEQRAAALVATKKDKRKSV